MIRKWPKALVVCLASMIISLDLSEGMADEKVDNVIEAFGIARDGNFLVAPVTLGGRALEFVVDTGATGSIVDSALESYLTPALGPGYAQINGQGREKRYYIEHAYLGQSRQPLSGRALCVDLAKFREASGRDIRGVVGMDFLKSRVMRIDFDAGTMSFLKSVPPAAGTEFRLWRNKLDQPMINIELADDDSVPFVIDAGLYGFAIALSKFRFDELEKTGRLQPESSAVRNATFEGAKEGRAGRLDNFAIGKLRHERIRVLESERNQIGLDLLSNYLVTFDFPNDRLYLAPRANDKEQSRNRQATKK